jgi:predicted dienelactone hydrolase
MNMTTTLAASIFALLCAVFTSSAKGQELFKILRHDGAQVPIRVFSPTQQACPPLALISPGAGGTANTMKYLAEALRKDGWLAVVIGHKESGPDALRENARELGLRKGLLELTADAGAYEDRFADISAALTWAGGRCKPRFVALLGHSMGAATVMLEAGAKNKLGLSARDRFDTYVAMSPQGPGSIFPTEAWWDIKKPMLVLTGTRDKELEGTWKSRTLPYADMPGGCKWLGVIEGATHMNFAGVGFARKTEALTIRITTSFLDNLRGGRCGTPPAERGMLVESK